MFFFVGNESPLKALNKVHDRLYLDDGWSSTVISCEMVWYKGYSTDINLSDDIAAIVSHGYRPAGKWCVIVLDGDNYDIMHPPLRGFPLYEKDGNKTNIKSGDDVYDAREFRLTIKDQTPITLEQAAIIIGDILLENIVNFLKYNTIDEMNVLCSAGLDSTTSWAVLDSVTKDYTLHAYVPKDNDKLFREYLGVIREYESDLLDKISQDYWGYSMMSVFNEPTWYLTGYYAEVIQYRDGAAINALANYQGKKIQELCSETDYLYHFLHRPNIVEQYKDSMLVFENDQALKDYLCDTVFGDWQMWHVDNNMTFSPFADIRIPQTINRLSVEDITKNSVSGLIQRDIIKRFKPELLSLVSDYKNSKDVWANFKQNFANITLDPKVRVKIR